MSQVEIALVAIAIFAAFMLGYREGWRHRANVLRLDLDRQDVGEDLRDTLEHRVRVEGHP